MSGAHASLAAALEDLGAGRMVVVADSAGGPAQLVLGAAFADADAVNFMAREARGLVCLALTPERCEELGLELIPNRAGGGRAAPAFTVSIEAREGITTGISAADRARTIAVATRPGASAAEICSPGHVFPLRARPGGVLEHPGMVEAAVDLVRIAGLAPAAVTCAILDAEGAEMGRPELDRYLDRHGLRLVEVERVAELRREREVLVRRVSSQRLHTAYGEFESVRYRSLVDGSDHRALVKGQVAGRADVLVRVHPACPDGEAFRSAGCRCGELLDGALAAIAAEGEGVLLYLSPRGEQAHGRGDLGLGAQILADLGLSSLRLLTNDPAPAAGLERHGLTLVDEIAVEADLDPLSEGFLRV